MNKNVIQSSTNDPAEVIVQFVKKLDVFIKESIININKMKYKHQQMANFWKGDQYNAFSDILAQSIKDAAKELAELEKLKKQMIEKAELLRKATRK